MHMPKNDDKKPADLGSEASSWENLEASCELSSWSHERELRERNKTMRRVFEESGMDYGRDVMPADASGAEEMRKRAKVALELRHKQVKGIVEKMGAAHSSLDLCFLVDVTSSMGRHIEGVKTFIRAIVDMLTNEVAAAKSNTTVGKSSMFNKIRLAFVGYRDFNVPRNLLHFEVLDFIESVDTFHAFCGSIVAKCGGDAAEDVFGGLEKANALSWSTDGSTRMLYHIADAPCHGKEFHDYVSAGSDVYPNGDPLGRSHHSLLGQLADKEIFYYFGKITEKTNKMVDKFAAAYDGVFIVSDVKAPDALLDSVVSSASISLSNNVATNSSRHAKYAQVQFDKAEPNWPELPAINCLLYNFVLPTTVWGFLDAPEKKQPLKALVQIAVNPFAAGSERLVFYGRDVTDTGNPVDIVLKKFSDKRHQSYIHYEAAILRQNVAAILASQFTAELKQKLHHGFPIKFLKTQMLSYIADSSSGQRVFMSCEKRYPVSAQYLRFTNNMDYAMLELTAKLKGVDMAFLEQLIAFSHWTYQHSNGYLMVVDLQGIISTGTGPTMAETRQCSIELTDPAIHCCNKMRFGRTNMGEEGMCAFFSSHQCNDICAKMGLTVPEQFRSNANGKQLALCN